jgi:hypothetical protein
MVREKLTRRQLGAIVAAAAAPVLSRAQTQPSAEELLAAEREDLRGAIETLGKFDLPMATEPSFRFEP